MGGEIMVVGVIKRMVVRESPRTIPTTILSPPHFLTTILSQPLENGSGRMVWGGCENGSGTYCI